ncbi:hypothetical protein FRUB_04636 [Fimbriiglobus ruber]|uniref:Uncharacterized protein n=1 Tax=Fimbriiglobus ruber TaxID=1908690 RepID=A0A225DJX0_9BACT|nr:hypothetical protein FRUB_04636 [Fimbriiglobus ruber]
MSVAIVTIITADRRPVNSIVFPAAALSGPPLMVPFWDTGSRLP